MSIDGLGYAGVKKGDHLVACVSGEIFSYKAGKCTQWEKSMFDNSLKPKEAECQLTGDTFKVKIHGHESELKIKGSLLLNHQMEKNLAVKTINFEEAKGKI